MNRPFYLDYVRHMLRFYTRNLSLTNFKSEVDRTNWYACHEVLKQYSSRDTAILVYVYSSFDTLPDNVFTASVNYNISQNLIWDMMKEFEREIAKYRGLL